MSGAKSGPTGLVDHIEETLIAALLGLMTVVTFANVIARFVFNSNILWALELTVFAFGWLVLLGASYAVKKHAHLGVDAFVRLFGPGLRRIFGLIAVAAGLVYGTILLVGAYDYVGKLMMIGIPAEDLPVPLWVPMAILPIGLARLLIRLLQVGWKIVTGEQEGLLLGDEAREAIDQHLHKMDEPDASRWPVGSRSASSPGEGAGWGAGNGTVIRCPHGHFACLPASRSPNW